MRYETMPKFHTWLADSKAAGTTGRVAAMATAFQSGNHPNLPAPARSIDLKPIDDLVSLYEKAWSPMARRNVLVDLKRELTKWCVRFPAKVNLATVALQEVVNRTLDAYPSGRFTDAICVGWAIGCNYRASTGFQSRNTLKNPDYFAHSIDDATDMARKCREMVTAVRAAKSAIAVQGLTDNDRTLKIFMAPEFFFRGVNGAYSPEIVADILPFMVRELGSGWSDWLFVFGTAVASIVNEEHRCSTCPKGTKVRHEPDPLNRTKTVPKCSRDTGVGPPHVIQILANIADVQNVALVHHDGESHVVAKEYISGIDYKGEVVQVEPGTANARNVWAVAPEGSHQSHIKSVFDDERMGGCILNIAGLTVALEVCLDHIASPVPNTGRASKYAATTQILLIPSYGMEIGTGLYCRPGGIVFNVDGRGRGNSHIAVKGGAKPTVMRTAIVGGPGLVEVWSPVPIPQ